MKSYASILLVALLLVLGLVPLGEASIHRFQTRRRLRAYGSDIEGGVRRPKPNEWRKYYTAMPQASNPKEYADTAFACFGRFALCAYATCVPVIGSDPPVAECGCYSYEKPTYNRGATVGILSRTLKEADTELCGAPGADCLDKRNKAKFCQAMNNGSMYPGANADFISTYNPDNWRETTGYQPSETTCESGGTSTNCFSAACYEGGPSSPYLQGVSSPAFNATCYCPYYVFDSSMSVWNATDDPCGPKKQSEIKEGTIIYNGL